jgi:hypothetical protein
MEEITEQLELGMTLKLLVRKGMILLLMKFIVSSLRILLLILITIELTLLAIALLIQLPKEMLISKQPWTD